MIGVELGEAALDEVNRGSRGVCLENTSVRDLASIVLLYLGIFPLELDVGQKRRLRQIDLYARPGGLAGSPCRQRLAKRRRPESRERTSA